MQAVNVWWAEITAVVDEGSARLLLQAVVVRLLLLLLLLLLTDWGRR
jgi:hypothetical protein